MLVPTNNSIAVLDLGTNTFHMVCFQRIDGKVLEQYRKRHYVFLSEEGIKQIGSGAMKRAQEAIIDFSNYLQDYPNITIRMVGTAALRNASNGRNLIDFIESHINGKVEVIGGAREAILIGKGVIWAKENIDNAMVVDIGGGSVEFIHIEKNQIQWLHSFPVGIGVLYRKFQHQEPISKLEIENIQAYLEDKCAKLVQYISTLAKPLDLIGASGSFELLKQLVKGQELRLQYGEVTMEEFTRLRDKIIGMDYLERTQVPYLPIVRVQLAVVSFLIMEWIFQKVGNSKIGVSKYAVKEGVVYENMIEK